MKSSHTRAVSIAVLVSIGLGLLVTWFAWPAKELQPRNLPVMVAGPAPAANAMAAQLASVRPGAFDVTLAADGAAADAALRDRTAYAAFVLSADGVSLHTASAASPTVAALLTQAAQQLGNGHAVPVVDVVAGSADDPRGAGLGSGFLPLVLASLIAGVLLWFLAPMRSARVLGVVLYAAVAGLVGAGVLHALGLIGGGYLAAAGVISLTALAVTGAVVGIGAALGRPGIVLVALVIFPFGVPISAVAAAPELLPQPWGAIGQFLPAGAAGTLLRSATFFHGAGSAVPLWALVAWACVGLLLCLAPARRTRPAPAATPDVPATAAVSS